MTSIIDIKVSCDRYAGRSIAKQALFNYTVSQLSTIAILKRKKMTKQRTYSKHTLEAATLLGEQIRLGRKLRKWTEQNLADRAGISRATLQKIENGTTTCAIGLFFETAMLVGVNLFNKDNFPLTNNIEQARAKIALLPQRIQTATRKVDDDF